MRTEIQLQEAPADGVYVISEGVMLTVFFNLEYVASRDMYVGDSVYVNGRGYKDILVAIITDKYDQNDTQAILANYADALYGESLSEDKRSQYIEEYNNYQLYRDKAKLISNIVISRING